ncbi:MAG: hypothetical protein GY870_18805 [archaeon]|nr:hypothetical protein [archaeon]
MEALAAPDCSVKAFEITKSYMQQIRNFQMLVFIVELSISGLEPPGSQKFSKNLKKGNK